MRRDSVNDILVTGGAGFIGSHLVDRLMSEKYNVAVLDNLSSGRLNNIEKWLHHPNFEFIKGDLKDPSVAGEAVGRADLIFHFAANPEVRLGETEPCTHFADNLVGTFNLLEVLRRQGSEKTIVFSSTSTVYGEASVLPTPEDYGPCIPISTYGATKQGAEALIGSYAYTFNLQALILRFANIVGSRARIGVIVDFVKKLRKNNSRLEILGDGTQRKSYLYVDDCIESIFRTVESLKKGKRKFDIYNVGSSDQVTVARIAQIVSEELGSLQPLISFTGGVDDGRGWKGDVKNMHLSIEKLLQTGWKPRFTSGEAVRMTVRKIKQDYPE